jgi:adenosylmethionine-8-amino-7-oxononanoate aminotransferase
MAAQYRALAPPFAALKGVENIRFRGGVFAFELSGDQAGYLDPIGRRVCDRAFPQGLYIRPLGNTIYLMPPFCITEVELQRCMAILFEATVAELGE